MPKYAPRDPRQPRWPQPQNNIPFVRTVPSAQGYIANFRTFYAPRLVWEDRDSNGRVIASTTYGIAAANHSPRGIKKCYIVTDIGGPESGGRLFLYDYKTEQWYRNAAASLETEDHPLHPCTPPDKSMIALPAREFLYLVDHTPIDLLEKKINGGFEIRGTTTWSNRSGTWIIDDEHEWIDWK